MAKKPLAPQPASEEEQREEASHSEAESPSEEESEEESDNSSESEDDEDGEAFENVSVDFDFSEPQEGDYHGIKALLSSWAHDLQAEAPAIADLVLSQARIRDFPSVRVVRMDSNPLYQACCIFPCFSCPFPAERACDGADMWRGAQRDWHYRPPALLPHVQSRAGHSADSPQPLQGRRDQDCL